MMNRRLQHDNLDKSQRLQGPQHQHEQQILQQEEGEEYVNIYKYLNQHNNDHTKNYLVIDDTHDHDRTLEDTNDKNNIDDRQQQESSSPTHHFSLQDEFLESLNDANDHGTISIPDITKHSSRVTNSARLTETRASIIDSIEWLGRHVPCCVLSQISREVLDYKQGNPMDHNFTMPHALPYKAALLFVDMSGFTKLSQSLDVESLSKTINSYFQAIVDEVTAHGGDILKFAGDAIFAEWRVYNTLNDHEQHDELFPSEQSNQSEDEYYDKQVRRKLMTVEDCVHAAAECGAVIVHKCSDYPVYSTSVSGGKGLLVSTLNVHCGLGVGKMVGIHVGNNINRREYLFLGEPIDQVAEACNAAKSGELKASRQVLRYLELKEQHIHLLQDKYSKSVVIASRQTTYFHQRNVGVTSREDRMQKSMFSVQSYFNIPFDEMDLVDLECFHRILSFYIHPVVLSDEKTHLGKYSATRDDQNARQRHRAEAELRCVFTMFLMPKIKIELTDNPEQNKKIYDQLHFIMNAVTTILDTYKGHLRQYMVDDKGVVLIATFGLRGSTFPNLVSERALPSCRRIHDTLLESLGIECQIGATLGKVYCGVVGGLHRHEYAVLGPSVNLSARLMNLKNHPGILVDDAVRQKVNGINFIPYPPVKAKGYIDAVPVFKPLSSKEARWGRADPKFVGRRKELDTICNISKSVTRENNPPNVVFVWGESGSGKSSFIVQAIAKVRSILLKMRKRVVITRNISSEGDMLVPFSVFRSIFRDVLNHRPKSDHTGPESQCDASSTRGRDWDANSLESGSSYRTESSNAIAYLKEICEEMHAPLGFLEIVGQHLLGDSDYKKLNVEPKLEEIISFMADVFIKSISTTEGVILALDDVQWMDSLSWKVLQCIIKRKQNIVLICASRPINHHSVTVDKEFWKVLIQELKKLAVFSEITIGRLDATDVRAMASFVLSCEPCDIDNNFCDDIFTHSGGMPYFASEILANCMKNEQCQRLGNGKIGWKEECLKSRDALKFSNIEEMFLQRLDNLDEITRKTLHFAVVLGMSFKFSEVLDLALHMLASKPEDDKMLAETLQKALKFAISERILDEIIPDFSGTCDEHCSNITHIIIDTSETCDGKVKNSQRDFVYSFHHDTWRRVILSLLLDSYLQDIHKHAAIAIEDRIGEEDSQDYATQVKLFRHWKESANTVRAAQVALDIGRNFKLLGMNLHSIQIYQDAIEMWKKHEPAIIGMNRIAGFSPQVIESLDEENLVSLVKLQTAMGQAIGSIISRNKAESAQAFETALEILRVAPVGAKIKDRAFIFPIYSGMFFLLKYGALCNPSEQVQIELDLVDKFVKETKRHGDPVHYSRALAMQSETFHRVGRFGDAIQCHLKLREVYNVDEHSARVVASYASDRCAQNFGCAANCYVRLGQIDKALEIADFIEYHLMPKMDLQNVHNSAVMVYPILWIWKDQRMTERSLRVFEKYVKEPFEKYFAKDCSTPFLPAFKPTQVLLDISMYMEGKKSSFDESYFEWAMDFSNLECPMTIDISIGNFSRSPMSISAEICLELSKLTKDEEKRKILLKNGVKLAELSMIGCDGKDGNAKNITAYVQIKPVQVALQGLLKDCDLC